MGFDEHLARYEREFGTSPPTPDPPATPAWSTEVVDELRRAELPRVALHASLPVRRITPLLRPAYDLHAYRVVTQGWALRYQVEYRDGYLTSGQILISEDRASSGGFISSKKRRGGTSAYGKTYVGVVREGLPREGGWVLNGPPDVTWGEQGAALIVALLRTGRGLSLGPHGLLNTH